MSGRRATNTQELLRQMSSAVVPVDEPERVHARRERVVTRLEALHDELDERRKRTQQRTRRIAVLAVAAMPLLALGGYGLAKHATGTVPEAPVQKASVELSVQSGSVLLVHGSAAELTVHGDKTLAAGDRVRTEREGRAQVTLHSGTDVEMSPATELTLGAEVAGWRSESVDLALGRVDVSVPKLPSGGSFAVMTPDASVEVHGTHFTVIVERGASGELLTRVAVRDGKVLVQSHGSKKLLGRGAHWSSVTLHDATPAPRAEAKTHSAASGQAPARPDVPGSAKSRNAAPPSKSVGAASKGGAGVASASSLAEQNRLFQAAMDARRRGDNARALSLLDQLLGRYPDSPLEQDARVERFRALKSLGRKDDATHAARRYLAEHPEGFARDEARQMALDPASH